MGRLLAVLLILAPWAILGFAIWLQLPKPAKPAEPAYCHSKRGAYPCRENPFWREDV